MRFLGTEMYMVTFLITAFEVIMLLFQIVFYLQRTTDKKRFLYLLLIVGVILYNICSGFLPDKDIPIAIPIQNGIAYFVSFCVSMYFVWYFYLAFELKHLKFFATFGSFYFLFLPFLLLFVLPYAITGDLALSRQLTVVIPFIYGLVFIGATTRAFKIKFKQQEYSDKLKRQTVISAYFALICWVSLPVIVFFGDHQVIQHSITNAGFLTMSLVYVQTMIEHARREYSLLQQTEQSKEELVANNCKHFGLTVRESEIAKLLGNGLPYKIIASTLSISEKTVAKHVSNIFAKVKVTNKIELILKLEAKALPLPGKYY